jgi:FtsH-binding integral membrane protein
MHRIIRILLLSSGIGCILLLTAFALSFLNLYTLLPWLISCVAAFVLGLTMTLLSSKVGIFVQLIRVFSLIATLLLVLGAFKVMPLSAIWNSAAAVLLSALLNGFILSNKQHLSHTPRNYALLFGINIVPVGILLHLEHPLFYTFSGIGLLLFSGLILFQTFKKEVVTELK